MVAQDELVPIAELARLAGYTRSHVYQLIKDGRGPVLQPHRQGVALSDAIAWLKTHSKTAREVARATALRRLHELYEMERAAGSFE